MMQATEPQNLSNAPQANLSPAKALHKKINKLKQEITSACLQIEKQSAKGQRIENIERRFTKRRATQLEEQSKNLLLSLLTKRITIPIQLKYEDFNMVRSFFLEHSRYAQKCLIEIKKSSIRSLWRTYHQIVPWYLDNDLTLIQMLSTNNSPFFPRTENRQFWQDVSTLIKGAQAGDVLNNTLGKDVNNIVNAFAGIDQLKTAIYQFSILLLHSLRQQRIIRYRIKQTARLDAIEKEVSSSHHTSPIAMQAAKTGIFRHKTCRKKYGELSVKTTNQAITLIQTIKEYGKGKPDQSKADRDMLDSTSQLIISTFYFGKESWQALEESTELHYKNTSTGQVCLEAQKLLDLTRKMTQNPQENRNRFNKLSAQLNTTIKRFNSADQQLQQAAPTLKPRK